MNIIVNSVDYAPEELYGQVPFSIELLRELPGSDRSDYWLGRVGKPLLWINGDIPQEITHVIVASRYQGARIEPLAEDIVIGIAYVTDATQIEDPSVDFKKCPYVAIGSGRVNALK